MVSKARNIGLDIPHCREWDGSGNCGSSGSRSAKGSKAAAATTRNNNNINIRQGGNSKAFLVHSSVRFLVHSSVHFLKLLTEFPPGKKFLHVVVADGLFGPSFRRKILLLNRQPDVRVRDPRPADAAAHRAPAGPPLSV